MKKILFLVILFCASLAKAQQPLDFYFADSIQVSAGGHTLLQPWAGGMNFPLFSDIDLNQDGLQDLFVFERSSGRVMTFLNTGAGGVNSYQYMPGYAKQFPELRGWAFLYDYNCDGKADLFTTTVSNNGIMQYRNDSPPDSLVFTLVEGQVKADYGGGAYSNILASGFLTPNFNDIDGDGDMDILGQQFFCVGGFAYYKNLSMEQYGVCDSLNKYVLDTYAWGKFTLRSGNYSSVAVGAYHVSCSQNANADTEEFGYQLARRDDTYANVFTIDIDGDGDKDVLVGDSQASNSLLVLNGGNNIVADMYDQDTLFPSYDTPVQLSSFTTHAYVDVDHDGTRDLLVANNEFENKQGVLYYRNNGTNAVPHFNYQFNGFLQNEMIDWGDGAAPVFFDASGDGLLDLIIGYRALSVGGGVLHSGLAYYKNTGTATSPAFEFQTDNYAGVTSLSLQGPLIPTFGDLDDDGDEDMVIGSEDGRLYYFVNSAGGGQPANMVYTAGYWMGVDIGNTAAPQLIDLNRDGKLDLVVGEKNGVVNYLENVGTLTNPFFLSAPTNPALGGIALQTPSYVDGYTVPFVFDDSGDYRMVVSCMRGRVYTYSNIDGNLGGNFTQDDSLITGEMGVKLGFLMTVSGGDLNDDGYVDLVYGLYGGGAQIYLQRNPTTGITDVETETPWELYPNPAKEEVTLRWKDHLRHPATRVLVQDIAGRTLKNVLLQHRENRIGVDDLPGGVYFVRPDNNSGIPARRLIIVK